MQLNYPIVKPATPTGVSHAAGNPCSLTLDSHADRRGFS
jgi:hypothetical protein